MASIYKLQYNGMTLAYPGWNGYVSFEYDPIQLVQFGAAGNATATLGITATYNGETTSWNNAGSTAYKDIPVGSEITITASTPEYFRCGCAVPRGVDNFASATWSRGFSAHGTVTGSGYASTTNTTKNTFTARGNLKWTNKFTGSYQGCQQAWPSLQITAWTSTYTTSSTMTGGEGTSYGATGTNKAGNLKGNRAWISITDWKTQSLKAPVNCSAWRLSGTMNITAQHNAVGGAFTGADERALTAGIYCVGTGAAPNTARYTSWFNTSTANKTASYTYNATAAKYGTATNLGSYSFGVLGQNYASVTVGSGATYSWAYNRILGVGGTWYASGILP